MLVAKLSYKTVELLAQDSTLWRPKGKAGADKLGQRATVVGVVRFGGRFLELDIPPGHLPPNGQCRLWYPDRPPGLQPPPAPCPFLISTAPVDTVVIDHRGRIVLDQRVLLTVSAVAIELGDFLQIDGAVATPPDFGVFRMNVSLGEPIVQIAAKRPLQSALSEATHRIVSAGELLSVGP
jgi:hypothetical protein